MLLAHIIPFLTKALVGFRSHLAFHRTTRELSALSDHALRDIGINRMDIDLIARGSLSEAPAPKAEPVDRAIQHTPGFFVAYPGNSGDQIAGVANDDRSLRSAS